MARDAAHDGLVPVGLQPGRIDDFINGMRDANKTKGVVTALAIGAVPMAWSSFRKYMRTH